MRNADVVDIAGLRERAIDADWLEHEHDGLMEASAENVAAAAAYAYDRWCERAAELGREEPPDLSGACKFCALFAKTLFGGAVDGNYDHVFVRLDGAVIDLSARSADVAAMDDPYRSDPEHLWNEDLHYSLATCLPRIRAWVAAYPLPASGPTP